MQTDQHVVHVRGDDLQIPCTITLDQSRTLDGSEEWEWVVKKTVAGSALVTKTSPSGILINGTTKQPTIVLAAGDFLVAKFPDTVPPQQHIHELEMTKDSKVETVLRGQFTVLADVVAV